MPSFLTVTFTILAAFCFTQARADVGPELHVPTTLLAPGGQPPPAGCGLPCQPKAKVTVSLSTGWDLPLQGQEAWADFQITNTSLSPIGGVAVVTLNGALMTNANPAPATLAPGQTFNGQAWIADAPAGSVSLRVQYRQLPECTGPIHFDPSHPSRPNCTVGTLWGEGFGEGTVYPDGDHDGIGDNYENLLLQLYAPLLLFSYDHGSEEKYAPIDVIDFIKASSLVSKEKDVGDLNNAALASNPSVILNPTNAPAGADPIGTISSLQQSLGAILGTSETDSLPRPIYLSPNDQAQSGTAWTTVMSKKNVGLYGHVVMLNVAEIATNAGQAFSDPVAQSENELLANELTSKLCGDQGGDGPCQATIFKIEYWQFFGYSHDFEDPLPATQDIAADIIDHGGDWCTVQLYVDPTRAFTQPDQAILAVYHFAHGLRFGFDLERPGTVSGVVTSAGVSSGLKNVFTQYSIKQYQGPNIGKSVDLPYQGGQSTQDYKNAQNNVMQLALDTGTNQFAHPVVYIEWGGHEFWPIDAWSLKYASKHGGDSKEYHYIANIPLNVGEVGAPMPGVAQAAFVTGFSGFWGYYGWENHNKPPPGPPLHAEWLWNPNTSSDLLKQRPLNDLPPW